MSASATATMTTLGELAALLRGATLVGDPAVAIQRVHSDTRSLRAGDLFVALKGERFDAHDFLAQAKSGGAVAALAERGLAEAGLPGLLVRDAKQALGALAAAWRARFAALPLIAVTGSNGKTTVTQMTASILRAWVGDATALATEGNLNNDIGVPLTLLRLRTAHRAAVVELGMNHPGEIAELAAMARPTVALVNNAQREHQEFMASVEAVARENGAVLETLASHGTAVFPEGDPYTALWRGLATGRRVVTFGLDQGQATVRGRSAPDADGQVLAIDIARSGLRQAQPERDVAVRLRLAGRHNAHNALAAAACALASGAPLEAVVRGLETFEPVKGRSQRKALPGGATLIDDSYNANPDSVRAAIDVLAQLPAPRWLVLGDMGEVGQRGPEFHAEVGAYARERGIESLWVAGTLCAEAARAYGATAHHFDDAPALVAALAEAPAFASVLVKGSRFMRMERVVAALSAPSGGGAHAA